MKPAVERCPCCLKAVNLGRRGDCPDCYRAICPVCLEPILKDENMDYNNGFVKQHLRCKHGPAPRPSHMKPYRPPRKARKAAKQRKARKRADGQPIVFPTPHVESMAAITRY